MGTRRRGREAALQMLYQIDVSEVSSGQATKRYWHTLASSQEGQQFADRIVSGWYDERDKIDETIRSVSEHWRLERMARVDRNILRLATFELLRMPDVPKRVTLNEAVELAKRFGSEGSARFVNGVLDRIAEDLGKQ